MLDNSVKFPVESVVEISHLESTQFPIAKGLVKVVCR